MTSKVVSLEEASGLISPGDIVAMGGLGLQSRPMALVDAIIQRSGLHGLDVLDMLGGLNVDWLVGSGVVKRVRAAFVSLELFGLAPYFRRAVEEGKVSLLEETELTIAQGLRAAMLGVPFLPVPEVLDSELAERRSDFAVVQCPFTGRNFAAVQPVRVDVALIHALEADTDGNAVLPDARGMEAELAIVARRVIVSAERVVPRGSLRTRAELPGFLVTAVVECPGGSRPSGCPPLYGLDAGYHLAYVRAAAEGRPFHEARLVAARDRMLRADP